VTTLNEARTDVYHRFLSEWVGSGGEALTPFCFGNEVLDAAPEWAQCFVVSMPNSQETLGPPGNRKFKRRAMVHVTYYGVPGQGMSVIDARLKVAMDMFEGRSLGTGVKFYEASSSEIGLDKEGRWFLSAVQAYFDYEEIK
jgi:hypothetical protein